VETRRGHQSNDDRVPSADPRIIFGKHIRKLRHERGLSQEKLAELADLHRNYVGGVEPGERNIAIIDIVRLALAFSK
jgi:transcriptional regulator with XRE-family HTH domain